jgi:hypothetical protein
MMLTASDICDIVDMQLNNAARLNYETIISYQRAASLT